MIESFEVPHSLFEMEFKKTDLLILIVLIKIKNEAVGKVDIEFFVASNKLIARYARIDLKTLRRVKARLKYKGL